MSLPYWNWGLGSDAETADLFQDDRIGPRGGIVTSGYFAEAATAQNPLGWTIHPDLRPFGSPLRRTGSAGVSSLPSEASVFEALEKSTFSTFRPALEGGTGLSPGNGNMHNGVHGWVGGDMGRMTSPNDPIFFMHHAQIDRIWAIWQRKHPGVANYNNANISVGQGHGPSDNMWPWDAGASAPGTPPFPSLDPAVAAALIPTEAPIDLLTPEDVLDHHALGYAYDDENPPYEIARAPAGVTHVWSAITLQGSFDDPPAVIAAMQTFNGDNPAAIRLRNVQAAGFDAKVEEEQSKDPEVSHVPEEMGFFASASGGLYDASSRRIGEVGRARRAQPQRSEWERIGLSGHYINPVVVMQLGSFYGTQPAHLRIRNVEGASFEFQIEEWAYLDGVHLTEDVGYLVLERGRYRFPDGSMVEAGTVNVDHKWASVSFTQSFPSEPVVLSNCQTRNGSDPIVTRQRGVKSFGFEVRLQEEEYKDGTHVVETVGYVACFGSNGA